MLSNNARPPGTADHRWTSTNGVNSNRCTATWLSCKSCNHDAKETPTGTSTRTGTVFMNNPTTDWPPASSAGRPDPVRPNTTSSSPDVADRTFAHAACTTVESV